jgi:hypothetical protein
MDFRNEVNKSLSGLLICIGLIFLGHLLKTGIENFKKLDRVVTVKGLSEREVKADKVIWPLTYKEVGNDLLALNNTVTNKNKEIVEFLKRNGIKSDEITVSAPEIIDMEAERYVSNTIRHRYNMTSVITVVSSNVDLVKSIMDNQSELINKGIAIGGEDYRYQKQFLFNGLNKIKPGMIEEATKNARASALKFAQDSQSKLGKIRSADQGQFSINDRDANTPYIKIVRVVTTVVYYLED